MHISFDISADELQIFMAEANEQIQMLDDGLVRLERGGENTDLLQAIFRAAHTLKGSAGAIGHKRMAELTHAMETALDGLRKHTLAVSTALIDTCLEAADALRLLLKEVEEGEVSSVETGDLLQKLSDLVSTPAARPPSAMITKPASPKSQDRRAAKPEPPKAKKTGQTKGKIKATTKTKTKAKAERTPAARKTRSAPAAVNALPITANIAPDSVAPAARLFQIMLSLQGLGDIVSMSPSQEQIEAAVPERHFTAQLLTRKTPAEIQAALAWISEIEQLQIGDQPLVEPGAEAEAAAALAMPEAQTAQTEVLDTLKGRFADKTVRTSVERLDNLMNLVGELITDRNRMYQIRTDFENRLPNDAGVDNLVETAVHIGRITDQLQEEVMHIRMLPISNVFNRFPRLVRDLARKGGKLVELEIYGEDTELDRSVIEEINDPLIHLLRNAVDHGIETPAARRAAGKAERGAIVLTARHEENRIIITVKDDGQGIDAAAIRANIVSKGFVSAAEAAALSDEEAIQYIYRSGLSTAKVVSDVSGRGVGMDIVRANIERLNGTITVETWPGRGTLFQVALPLTLAIIPALLVISNGNTLAIPLGNVAEVHRIAAADIHRVNNKPVIRLRDQVLPIVRLSEALSTHTAKPQPPAKREFMVTVRWGKMDMGLVVERLIGEQELVIKSMGALVGEVFGTSGAAILGDGRVALIVDVPGLFKLAGA